MYEYVGFIIFFVFMIIVVMKYFTTSMSVPDRYIYIDPSINTRLTKIYYDNQTKFNQIVLQLKKDGYGVVKCTYNGTIQWCVVYGRK